MPKLSMADAAQTTETLVTRYHGLLGHSHSESFSYALSREGFLVFFSAIGSLHGLILTPLEPTFLPYPPALG